MTTRGMKEEEARKIAQLITKVINEREASFEYVTAEVAKLCEKFPLYADCVR
jgi:glycine hydroxymethyltransferase